MIIVPAVLSRALFELVKILITKSTLLVDLLLGHILEFGVEAEEVPQLVFESNV